MDCRFHFGNCKLIMKSGGHNVDVMERFDAISDPFNEAA